MPHVLPKQQTCANLWLELASRPISFNNAISISGVVGLSITSTFSSTSAVQLEHGRPALHVVRRTYH